MNAIKQLTGKMTSDLDALAGCLSAPWGAQGSPTYSTVNHIVHQNPPGNPYPPQGEWAHGGHGRCTHVADPSQHPVSLVPTDHFPQTTTQSGQGTHWIEADR